MLSDILCLFFLLLAIIAPVIGYLVDRWGFEHVGDHRSY